MPLTISQFAAAGDVGVETVRFYQRKGLLPVPDTGAGIRRYGEADVRRLRFIRMAQRAGFSLEEIRQLLELYEPGGTNKAQIAATISVAI